MKRSSPKVLAFTPTYNEAGNMQPLIEALLALDLDLEVLVVDDLSPDGTGGIVEDLARRDPRIHLVSRRPPRGRGYAGREGFSWFQAHPEFDVLIEMDADFSHHPRFIPPMVQALKRADVVIGSRFIAGGGEVGRDASRQLTSQFANAYLRLILHTRQRDCTTGFRGFTRKALDGIDFTNYIADGPPIVTEVLFDQICRRRKIVEIPILFEDRKWGESKLSLKVLLKSLWFPLLLRLRRVLNY